jgi:hypothetical protein
MTCASLIVMMCQPCDMKMMMMPSSCVMKMMMMMPLQLLVEDDDATSAS